MESKQPTTDNASQSTAPSKPVFSEPTKGTSKTKLNMETGHIDAGPGPVMLTNQQMQALEAPRSKEELIKRADEMNK